MENTPDSPDVTRAPATTPQVGGKPKAGVGTVIAGRYKLLADIGYGGMGRVFRALDTKHDELRALKIMHNHLQSDATNVKRFEREAELALGLKHENIVEVIDFGLTETGEPFIVMELLKGESLDDLLKHETRLPLDLFAILFPQICEGLSYSHASNVVHRDIKPSNIMIIDSQEGEQIKIVDFGIARVCGTTGVVCPTSSTILKAQPESDKDLSPEQREELQRLTQPGEIFGSPLYMSPEQCQGEEADCRSEVYAMGCMMFESLTGKPPLKGENAMDTLLLRINEEAPAINKVVPGVTFPDTLEAVVAKALKRDPNERYQEVYELNAALNSVFSQTV